MKKKNSIRDILKFQNETATPLGILLYAAAKKIVAILWHSPNKGVVKIKEGISPLDVNQIIFSASVCFSLVMVSENERDKFIESTISDMDTLYDMSVDFLRQFPTQELARENFPRPVVFSDNSVMSYALDVTEQIKNLPIDEAHDLILARPLVRNFKDNLNAAQLDALRPVDGSITITTGKDLSEISHEDLMNGLAKIQSALEKSLPPGMKELILSGVKSTKIPAMVTGKVIPPGVILKELGREREDAKHTELVKLQEEILAELKKRPNEAGQEIKPSKTALPEIEDPTDQRIWEWIKEDPSITDTDIAQKLGISRQAVNPRRRSLEKMGYSVRRVSRLK